MKETFNFFKDGGQRSELPQDLNQHSYQQETITQSTNHLLKKYSATWKTVGAWSSATSPLRSVPMMTARQAVSKVGLFAVALGHPDPCTRLGSALQLAGRLLGQRRPRPGHQAGR